MNTKVKTNDVLKIENNILKQQIKQLEAHIKLLEELLDEIPTCAMCGGEYIIKCSDCGMV
jgi:hypothetical protein